MSGTGFNFGSYKVRPVAEADRAYLDKLIQADPYHAGKMTADFFLKLHPGEDAWGLEDGDSKVVFYFKTATAVRISIQFAQSGNLTARRRTGLAILEGLAWVVGMLRQNRFREIFFDTEGPELRNFAKRRMGFTETPELLSLPLDIFPVVGTEPKAMGSVPTSRLERRV